jgi:predicted CoA-binding protein
VPAQKPKRSEIPDLSRDLQYVLYGVSRKRRGFGYQVARTLDRKGFTFFIVHPETDAIDPWSPVRHVQDLPQTPDAAILCSPPEESRRILEELHRHGVTRVYAARGSVDDAGRAFAAGHDFSLWDECPLLHVQGLGFPHNLHRWLAALFGR